MLPLGGGTQTDYPQISPPPSRAPRPLPVTKNYKNLKNLGSRISPGSRKAIPQANCFHWGGGSGSHDRSRVIIPGTALWCPPASGGDGRRAVWLRTHGVPPPPPCPARPRPHRPPALRRVAAVGVGRGGTLDRNRRGGFGSRFPRRSSPFQGFAVDTSHSHESSHIRSGVCPEEAIFGIKTFHRIEKKATVEYPSAHLRSSLQNLLRIAQNFNDPGARRKSPGPPGFPLQHLSRSLLAPVPPPKPIPKKPAAHDLAAPLPQAGAPSDPDAPPSPFGPRIVLPSTVRRCLRPAPGVGSPRPQSTLFLPQIAVSELRRVSFF